MTILKNQKTALPNRKIAATALGGALATIIIGALMATEVPYIVRFLSYTGMQPALAVLFAVVCGYQTRDKL